MARPELYTDHTRWRAGQLIGDTYEEGGCWMTPHYDVATPHMRELVRDADAALINAALSSIAAMGARKNGGIR